MNKMDDLVKRLRIIERIEPRCFLGEGNAMHEVAKKAADEIERLKRELYKCKIEAKTIVDFNDELQQRIAELEAEADPHE